MSPLLLAQPVIPVGQSPNALYYQLGGASDIRRPTAMNAQALELKAEVDLGLGRQCGFYNPALSIQNSLNHLQDNLTT